MNTIILTGVRNIKTDDVLQPQRDYMIALVGERISEEKMDTFSDSKTEEIKYKIKISRLLQVTDIGSGEKIEVKEGKSKSQILRFIVEKELGEYDAFIDWLIANQQTVFDLYRERIN